MLTILKLYLCVYVEYVREHLMNHNIITVLIRIGLYTAGLHGLCPPYKKKKDWKEVSNTNSNKFIFYLSCYKTILCLSIHAGG